MGENNGECREIYVRTKVRSLLLHICCGNCACFPKKILEENEFKITGFWYNPNIHPFLKLIA